MEKYAHLFGMKAKKHKETDMIQFKRISTVRREANILKLEGITLLGMKQQKQFQCARMNGKQCNESASSCLKNFTFHFGQKNINSVPAFLSL